MKPRQFKIPTLLGMFSIVCVGILIGFFLLYSKQILTLFVPAEERPQQVRITNVTSNSFTVSWVTRQETEGLLKYGSGKTLDNRAGQDSQISSPSLVHSVQVGGLKPETTYNFQVGTGNGTFGKYSLNTSKTIKDGEADIIFGTVVDAQKRAVRGALVYVTIQSVQPLSTVTDEKGGWTINFGRALSADLSRGASFDKNKSVIEVFVQTGKVFASARGVVGAGRPLPQLTLGKSYDFTKVQTGISAEGPKSQFAFPKGATESSQSSVDKAR